LGCIRAVASLEPALHNFTNTLWVLAGAHSAGAPVIMGAATSVDTKTSAAVVEVAVAVAVAVAAGIAGAVAAAAAAAAAAAVGASGMDGVTARHQFAHRRIAVGLQR